MTHEPNKTMAGGPAISDPCWRRIGVQGDRSCPELAAAVHCRNCAVFASAGQELLQREAPAEYVEEQTRQLARVAEAEASDAVSLLVFRVGPEWLALDTAAVVEVVPPRPIHRVPHRTDRLLLGLANIRGEMHLCISIRELLGIDPPPAEAAAGGAASAGPKERLLVTEFGPWRWVFVVDEVEGVFRVAAGAMEELPHTVQRSPRHFSTAIFSQGPRRVGRLSAPRLFQALEEAVQ